MDDIEYETRDYTPSEGYLVEPRDENPLFRRTAIVGGATAAAVGTYFFARELAPKVWDGFSDAYNATEHWVAAGLLGFGAFMIGLSDEDKNYNFRERTISLAAKTARAVGVVSLALGSYAAIDWLAIDENGTTSTPEITVPTGTTGEDENVLVVTIPERSNFIATDLVNPEGSRCEIYLEFEDENLTSTQEANAGRHAQYLQYWLTTRGGYTQNVDNDLGEEGPLLTPDEMENIDGEVGPLTNAAVRWVRTHPERLNMSEAEWSWNEDMCRNTPFGDCRLDTPLFARDPATDDEDQLAIGYPVGGSQATGC